MFTKKSANQQVADVVVAVTEAAKKLDAVILELDGHIQDNRDFRETLKAACHQMHKTRGVAVAMRRKLEEITG